MKYISVYEVDEEWTVELCVQDSATLYVDGLTREAAQALKLLLENARRLSIRSWSRHER